MAKTKRLFGICGALLCVCAALTWLTTSIRADERTYEVRPQVAVPYGYTPTTDASRLIDLIERLLIQNQQANQNRLQIIETNLQAALQKLGAIQKSIAQLSKRVSRIETALGIEQPKPPVKKNTPPKATEQKPAQQKQ